MDTVKINKNLHPVAFNLYLNLLRIRDELKPRIHTILVYLSENELDKCPFEIWDKHDIAISQG